MKICSKCSEYKNLTNFYIRNNLPTSACKSCERKRVVEWQHNNRSKRRMQRIRRKKTVTKLVLEFLLNNHCVDCEEDDPYVLDFDHINPDTKHKEVSTLISQEASWNRVKKEMDKCQIRCANCHRKKTHIERNTWKAQMLGV